MIKIVLSGILDCSSCYLFDFCDYMCEQGANLDYNVSPSNCRFFKDKSRIVELDKLKFTHVYMCEDGKLDSDTIFARIIDETDDTVTLERYQKFGTVQISNYTFSKQNFNDLYEDISILFNNIPPKNILKN